MNETAPHQADWQILEPVTVSGRYTAWSPSAGIEASVLVHVRNGAARIDRGAPAILIR